VRLFLPDFADPADPAYQIKTHFAYLVEYEKGYMAYLLFFKNYINSHQEALAEYQQLKMDFAKTIGIKEHTNHKEALVMIIAELGNGNIL
jgi:hypothetical protein